MWGENVRTDLQLDTLSTYIPFQLSWGRDAFQDSLQDAKTAPSASEIKRRQLPLLGLRANVSDRKAILEDCKALAPHTATLDDCVDQKDERITESIEQILWPADSVVSLLNTNSAVLNAILFLKTILAPGLSVVTPIIAFILPFVLAYITPGANRDPMAILEKVKHIFRRQVMIPTPVLTGASQSRFGSIVEMFFMGFALLIFIAGLWSQITAALHLRAIWFDVVWAGVKDSLRPIKKPSATELCRLVSDDFAIGLYSS